jgi:hypothetical protein
MRTLPTIVAIAALCTACATHRLPKSDSELSDWTHVMALTAEEPIEVATNDGRRVSGTVQSVDIQQIVLRPGSLSVRRDDVRAVWIIERADSWSNGTWIGAVAGLAAGLAANGEDNTNVALVVMATGVGAVLGAWLDRGWKGPPMRLVYSVNRP